MALSQVFPVNKNIQIITLGYVKTLILLPTYKKIYRFYPRHFSNLLIIFNLNVFLDGNKVSDKLMSVNILGQHVSIESIKV